MILTPSSAGLTASRCAQGRKMVAGATRETSPSLISHTTMSLETMRMTRRTRRSTMRHHETTFEWLVIYTKGCLCDTS